MSRSRAMQWLVMPALAAALALTTAAQVDNDAAALLSAERWRDNAYGISLRPPLGARQVRLTADEAMVRFTMPEGYAINAFVKQSREPLTMPQLIEEAVREMAKAHPSAVTVGHELLKIAGRDAAKIYFNLPVFKPEPWVTGEFYIRLEEDRFAIFRLECPNRLIRTALPLFEAVAGSTEIEDPEAVASERKELVERGDELVQQFAKTDLKPLLEDEQWYRIVERDRDMGYMRVRQQYGSLDPRLKDDKVDPSMKGYGIEVQARVIIGNSAFDTYNTNFLSSDGKVELWSIVTTERPLTPKQIAIIHGDGATDKLRTTPVAEPGRRTWAETGVRTDDAIRLNRRAPAGVKEFDWKLPPKGYLPQVHLYLLGKLIPQRPAQSYGFYAYNPSTGRITFRSERVEPLPNGGFRLFSRLSPDEPQQITDYSVRRRMDSRQLPGGRIMTPARLSEIQMRWRGRMEMDVR